MLVCSNCGNANPDGSRFCNGCGTSLGRPVAAGEGRKTITALFCDLVDSTVLGERYDPEVLRPVMDRYFEQMREAAEYHGGRVEKFIGDAVVALFGLPVAHEDDALRAVRAGVEMQVRLKEMNEGSPIPLAARIGITTGEVLVPAGESPVIGDAMNTASRLQSAAQPGEVLIGDPTWHLVRDAVSAEALEPVRAKGKADPLPAWRVRKVRASARSATPFVGRERYVAMLSDALTDAIAARAGVLVTILAPPGVGKSRLASTFASELGERAAVLVGQTPSYGEGVTFAPLTELLAQVAGRRAEEAEEIATRLRELVAAEPDGPSVGDRLAQFLGVGEALGADASWAVRRLLEVIAAEQPHVVVLEDIHWAEPPMLDLADAVVERVHGPVLFVCLARPELLEQRPGWSAGKPRSITMTLPSLPAEESRQIAELLLGERTPPPIVDRVCGTAEGNPLFLEQLTAMLVDQGLLVDGEWRGPPDAEVEIPGTLQALLAARLDRLGPGPRLILERASVEGRRFRVAMVRALTPELASGELETALAALDRSGLLEPEDEAAGRWRFTHALVLDAAYRGLSKGLRAELHERLAERLEQEDAEQADIDERAARHLERAVHLREELGLHDERSAVLSARAGELFLAAGSRAFAALDFLTARDLLGRASLLLPADDPRRLSMLPNLGVALTETGRSDETETLLSEAVAQSRAAGSERDALRAAIQLESNRLYRSPTRPEIDAAIGEAEAAVASFDAAGDDVGLAEASIVLEYLEFVRGRVARSLEWTHRALHHGLAARRFRESAQAAADVVNCASVGPLPFDRFHEVADERLFPLSDPISDCAGHALKAVAALASGDAPGFSEHERRWRGVVDRHGLAWLGATQGLIIATVEIHVGKTEAAERRLREAREVLDALGDIWWIATLDCCLCAAIAPQDRPQEFIRLVDALEASPLVLDPQAGVRRLLLRARVLLLRGSAVDAEAAARRGLELVGATDLTLDRVTALQTLADALDMRGLGDDADRARAEAEVGLHAKGIAVPADGNRTSAQR